MTKMLEEILQQPSVLAGIEKENENVIKELVKELNTKNINHVTFAGRGTSDHASIYGQYLMGIFKGAVSALAIPSCITLYNGKLDLSKDMVIGVSQSGKAADALAVIERGNQQGAITVAVTNDRESPLAKAAKYHLYCNAGPEVSVAATKTFTAQMYLLALLTAYWSENNELLNLLRALPETAGKMFDTLPAHIEKHVDRFRYINEGFVLSRGICYPIALESALKIQETCYIKMKGYAISDFYHGPLAQVDTDLPIIILASKGAAFDDSREMIYKITEIGAQVLVVTDDENLYEKSPQSILIPDTGSEVTAEFPLTFLSYYFTPFKESN